MWRPTRVEIASGETTLCTTTSIDDDYELFGDHGGHRHGEIRASGHALNALRLLGGLLDASGDDAALTLAKRTPAPTNQPGERIRAAIATWALVARARRRDESFPTTFFPLIERSDSIPNAELHTTPAYRDIFETLASADRVALESNLENSFRTRTMEVRDRGKERKVAVLYGTWWYADLLPAEPTARRMIEDIAAWSADPRPRQAILDVIEAVGPACVPHLDRALAAKTKSAHHALCPAAHLRACRFVAPTTFFAVFAARRLRGSPDRPDGSKS